jgi:hypothetical protein
LRSLIVSLLVAGLLACSDPRNASLSNDPDNWESELKPVLEKLSEEERTLLAQYMMRAKLGEAFGGSGIPTGLTVGAAIDDQRRFIEEEQRREAEARALRERVERERAAEIAKMDSVLSVAFVSKSYRDADYTSGQYQDLLTLVFAIENRSTKDIAGFKGTACFEDMFGDEISENNISYDETIPAGKAVRWRGSLNYNQFMSEHQKLRSTPPDKLRFRFRPEVVIFVDGSRIELPNES